MRVSAIIAVYNGADRFGAAIDSILAQDFAPYEIVVVDDGSTDATPDVIRSYGKKLRAFRQDNAGLSAAHNFALQQVKGDAIAFLDHDDLWTPGRLAAMVELLRSDDGIDIVSGQVQIEVERPSSEIDQNRLVTTHRLWALQSLLIRRRVFDRIGNFNTQLAQGMDIDWYMRAREAGVRYALLPKIALIYRLHDTNMTNDAAALADGLMGAFKNALDRKRRTP